MSKRLWLGIGWPSLVLNLFFGLAILFPKYFTVPAWLVLKLLLILLLIIYHFYLHSIYMGLQKSVYKYSSHSLRVINEIATLLLFGIVFLGVMKVLVNLTYFYIGMIILALLLYAGILIYKRKRTEK